jgi:toxin YoeB
MAKEIVWTETSVRDRLEIFKFWLIHNKSAIYSNKLEDLFNESVKFLAEFPQMGAPTDYKDLRVKIVRNYKLFYRDTPSRIEIIRVWDTRQDPKDLTLG